MTTSAPDRRGQCELIASLYHKIAAMHRVGMADEGDDRGHIHAAAIPWADMAAVYWEHAAADYQPLEQRQ
ncbi:MAG: hypothetical protein RL456_2740 [Pseudomonadota bacterium]|jgi:hypothetical protein